VLALGQLHPKPREEIGGVHFAHLQTQHLHFVAMQLPCQVSTLQKRHLQVCSFDPVIQWQILIAELRASKAHSWPNVAVMGLL